MSRPADVRRVQVCLFSQGNIARECTWAAPLGRDLYQLLNIPFTAGDVAGLRRRLEEWRANGLLDDDETCEARVAGSFDLPTGYRGQPPCWTDPSGPFDRTR